MDIAQHMKYWVESSDENCEVAKLLLEHGHLGYCLFTAHLALEKMLKAHVCKATGEMPPRIHNLVRLAEIAKVELSKEQLGFLTRLGVFQIEGRYPDTARAALDAQSAKDRLSAAQEMLEWLKALL